MDLRARRHVRTFAQLLIGWLLSAPGVPQTRVAATISWPGLRYQTAASIRRCAQFVHSDDLLGQQTTAAAGGKKEKRKKEKERRKKWNGMEMLGFVRLILMNAAG